MVNIVALPKCKRLKREQADAFRQLAFDFELSDDVRAEIDNVIYKLTEKPGERWLFVKTSPTQFQHVIRTIRDCPKPATTLAVWNAALPYMHQDTGTVLTTRVQLAEDSSVSLNEVSCAMSTLTKIGAILRTRRGNRVIYSINPHVGWNGGEGTRQVVAKETPKLRLVCNNNNDS